MWLLDGNVLVALAIDTHEFHERVQRWFDSQSEAFATCAITEGTLLRVHMRLAEDRTAAAAWTVLEAIHGMPDHVYWNDGFSYREVAFAGVTGSKQVTDAWLAELARRHNAQLGRLRTILEVRTIYPLRSQRKFVHVKQREFIGRRDHVHNDRQMLRMLRPVRARERMRFLSGLWVFQMQVGGA